LLLLLQLCPWDLLFLPLLLLLLRPRPRDLLQPLLLLLGCL
jgi:hypothetical protein